MSVQSTCRTRLRVMFNSVPHILLASHHLHTISVGWHTSPTALTTLYAWW